jgi:hypothetical protein
MAPNRDLSGSNEESRARADHQEQRPLLLHLEPLPGLKRKGQAKENGAPQQSLPRDDESQEGLVLLSSIAILEPFAWLIGSA